MKGDGKGHALISEVGNRYGRLVVRERHAPPPGSSKAHQAWWRAVCDCGQETIVAGWRMRSGVTLSCGCLRREHMAEVGRTKAGNQNRTPPRGTGGRFCATVKETP